MKILASVLCVGLFLSVGCATTKPIISGRTVSYLPHEFSITCPDGWRISLKNEVPMPWGGYAPSNVRIAFVDEANTAAIYVSSFEIIRSIEKYKRSDLPALERECRYKSKNPHGTSYSYVMKDNGMRTKDENKNWGVTGITDLFAYQCGNDNTCVIKTVLVTTPGMSSAISGALDAAVGSIVHKPESGEKPRSA